MKKINGPEIVIIITVIVAFSNFLIYNHSGIEITDVSFKEIYEPNSYNLSYYLRVGRNYNLLECQYSIYNQEGLLLYNDSSMLKNVYPGSHDYNKNIIINQQNPYSIEFKVYDRANSTNNTSEEIYSRSFNFTK